MSLLSKLQYSLNIWNNEFWANAFFIKQGFQVIHLCNEAICIWNFSWQRSRGWSAECTTVETETDGATNDDSQTALIESTINSMQHNKDLLDHNCPTYLIFPNQYFNFFTTKIQLDSSAKQSTTYLKWLLQKQAHIDASKYQTSFDLAKGNRLAVVSASSTSKLIFKLLKTACSGINIEQLLPEIAVFQQLPILKNRTAIYSEHGYCTVAHFDDSAEVEFINTMRQDPINDTNKSHAEFLTTSVADNYATDGKTPDIVKIIRSSSRPGEIDYRVFNHNQTETPLGESRVQDLFIAHFASGV